MIKKTIKTTKKYIAKIHNKTRKNIKRTVNFTAYNIKDAIIKIKKMYKNIVIDSIKLVK